MQALRFTLRPRLRRRSRTARHALLHQLAGARLQGKDGVALHLRLLGAPAAYLDGQAIALNMRPRTLPVLAYILLAPDRTADPRQIANRMWPEDLDEDALANIRRHLHYIRNWLSAAGADAAGVARHDRTITITQDAIASVDAVDFERLSRREETRGEAIALYRGDLLEGYDEEWIAPRRDALRETYLALLDAEAEAQAQTDARAAAAIARRALSADPWRESSMRALMRALESGGDRAGALREYQHFVRGLRDEMGADPSDATVRLAESMSSQLAVPRYALPRPITSFVGRETEKMQLSGVCRLERLVTIAGGAGVGKTRLASEIARHVESSFSDGVRFVDLAAINDENSIARAAQQALTYADDLPPGDVVEFERAVRDRAYLIVMDNCEHAAGAVASVVESLLRSSPRSHVLATSRVPLHLEGEAVWRLGPLEAGSDAVRLFFDRARAARPALRQTEALRHDAERICAALDGVPLAIELAAARVRTMSLRDVADQLIGRIGAMAQALRWSIDLLSERERRVLYRLCTFSGGLTMEAARAVCDGDIDDVMAVLVDTSLILAPDPDAADGRYRIVESVRQPGRSELLKGVDAHSAFQRHAQYFSATFVALDEDLRNARSSVFFDLVEREYENVHAALEWLVGERHDVEDGMKLALAISRYWFDRGLITEGAAWMKRALDAQCADALLRARVFQCLATVSRNTGDYAESYELVGRCVEQLRTGGADSATIGKALAVQCNAARVLGDFENARRLANEAIALFEPAGNAYLTAFGHTCVACTLYAEGKLEESEAAFARVYDEFESCGAEGDAALALANLGMCRFFARDYAIALARLNAALARSVTLRHRYCEAWARTGLCMVQACIGEQTTANEELARAAALARTIDDKDVQICCVEAAALCWKSSAPQAAAQAVGCGARARKRFHVPHSPLELPHYDALTSAVREALAPAALAIALEEGRFTTLEAFLHRIEAPVPAAGRFCDGSSRTL